ncbi:MAG: DUF1569 domain-containing protein [Planctomycetota bacterium]|nr:DUF1569 domain-containing protein [Planctomycetota bacterium]
MPNSEEVARLKRAIAKLQASDGPYHASPLLGDMSREELFQLQVIHAAHHLSFLIPMDSQGTEVTLCKVNRRGEST